MTEIPLLSLALVVCGALTLAIVGRALWDILHERRKVAHDEA